MQKKSIPQLDRVEDTPDFLKAKDVLGGNIPESVRSLTLWSMIKELEKQIKAVVVKKHGNKTRYFARHCLGIHGDEFQRVNAWIRNPSTMSLEECLTVLRFLSKDNITETEADKNAPAKPSSSDLSYKFAGHSITLLNSLNIMAVEINIQPKDVCDGDRMQMTSAMEEICKRFGITAKFSDPSTLLNKPVTRGDSEISVPRTRKAEG